MKRLLILIVLFVAAGCGPSASEIAEMKKRQAQDEYDATMRELDAKQRQIDAQAALNKSDTTMKRSELELRGAIEKK